MSPTDIAFYILNFIHLILWFIYWTPLDDATLKEIYPIIIVFLISMLSYSLGYITRLREGH